MIAFRACVVAFALFGCDAAPSGPATIQERCEEVDPITGGCAVATVSCTLPDRGAIEWSTTLLELGVIEGDRVTVACPPSGVVAPVYGTNYYTGDSSICTAAVHAGLITLAVGGELTVEGLAGADTYCASSANGIDAAMWDSYFVSFHFPAATEVAGACPRPTDACVGDCDLCPGGARLCLFSGSTAAFWEQCSLYIEMPSCDGLPWTTGEALLDAEDPGVQHCEVRRVEAGSAGPGWAVEEGAELCDGMSPATAFYGLDELFETPRGMQVVCP